MGHNIPTIFFPVRESEIHNSEVNKAFVEDLIAKKYHARIDEGIREVTSRNWWYQESIVELARYFDLAGLEFIPTVISVLDESSLRFAVVALDQLLAEISSGIPQFSGHQEDEYPGLKMLREEDCSRAFHESRPEFKIDSPVDFGFEAVVGFLSFLKSMITAMRDALANGQYLIYYRPQP